MKELSVIIICKNEAKQIGHTIRSVRQLTDDILCVDNGSTDGTQTVVTQHGGRIIEMEWQGYGKTKNAGIAAAKYDWILSIDADEPIDETLASSILSENLDDPGTVYNLFFQTYFADKRIRFGEWGRKEKHIRLFNRTRVTWANAQVHEQLVLPEAVKIKDLKGFVLHRTVESVTGLAQKTLRYAFLNAEKYFERKKKAGWINLYVSPCFSFVKNYLFLLGFLDGWEGYLIAKMNAHYIFLKYGRLRELYDNAQT